MKVDLIGAFLPETPAPGDPEDILYLKTHDCSSVFTVCQKYNTENVVCNASQSKKRRKREEEIEDKKEGEDEVNFDEFYDSLDFMLNPALENKYERGYNLLSKAYRDAFREVDIKHPSNTERRRWRFEFQIDLESWYQGVFKTLWGSHLVVGKKFFI